MNALKTLVDRSKLDTLKDLYGHDLLVILFENLGKGQDKTVLLYKWTSPHIMHFLSQVQA